LIRNPTLQVAVLGTSGLTMPKKRKEFVMNLDYKDLNSEAILKRYRKLYKPAFKPYHRQAIAVFGADRYRELAELALRQGKHSGRLMSSLLKQEYQKFSNRNKYKDLRNKLTKERSK